MRIGIVGCGYVADMYLSLLANHPILELGGITDRDGERAKRLAAAHKTRDYGSLQALLADEDVQTEPQVLEEVVRRAVGGREEVAVGQRERPQLHGLNGFSSELHGAACIGRPRVGQGARRAERTTA